jgi:CIC family chloride channel protein
MAVLASGLVGIAAGGLTLAVDQVIDLLSAAVSAATAQASGLGRLQLVVLPAVVFVAVVGVLRRWAPEAQGTGISQAMSALGRGGYLRKRIIFLKPLAAALCIGAGAPLGMEGPVVQTGAAIGSLASRWFRFGVGNARVLAAAGAAASLAAEYGAPVGGAVFGAEVLLGAAGVSALLPLIVATFMAVLTRHAVLGGVPEYIVNIGETIPLAYYPVFVPLGVLCGFAAAGFIKTAFRVEDLMARALPSWWMRAAGGGLLLGLVARSMPELMGTGKPVIQRLLESPDLALHVLVLFVLAKPLLSSVAMGSQATGGVFAPSLFVGAALGALIARLAAGPLGLGAQSTTVFVLAGMAGVMGAVMRAPLQAILITFELTRTYGAIPPLMVTCAISMKVSELLESESVFTRRLVRAGERLRQGLDFSLLSGVTVGDIMRKDFVALPAGAPITELADAVKASENTTFPAVGEDGALRGIVMLASLTAAGSRARGAASVPTVEQLLEPDAVHLEPDGSLYEAWETMGNYDYDCLPVCRRDGDRLRLLGVCEKEAIVERHDREAFVKLAEEAAAAGKVDMR